MTKHRGTCQEPGCGRVWRENCADCLTEVTDRHAAETGHRVHLSICADDESPWELRRLTAMSHRGLRSLPRVRRF